MPIEICWLIPDVILLSRWSGEVTEQDIQVLVEELGIILDNAPRLVHTIIDLSDIPRVNNETIYYYFRSRIPQHPRRGRVALVGGRFQAEMLTDIFNRVSQREMLRLFSSRSEARAFLLSHDSPPPELDDPANT